MLIDDRSSIYEHRPRTCRTYDCRVFPAAGLEPEGDDKALVAQRARRWKFSYAGEEDRALHDAVRAAATYLPAHPDLLPDGGAVATNTQLAVMAVEAHGAFLRGDPTEDEVRVVLSRRQTGQA